MAMALATTTVTVTLWMSCVQIPLVVWLGLNGVLVLIFAGMCAERCSMGDFDWEDIDRPLVVWALMAVWSDGGQPSWLRLILWMSLIPAEFMATLVLRPITLVVRALLKPLPGEWD